MRHIFLWIGLMGLLVTNGLQYTHDLTHHECHSDSSHEHASTDACSLCWFVSHQVLSDFSIDTVLPEATVSENILDVYPPIVLAYQGVGSSLKSNKDPPHFL